MTEDFHCQKAQAAAVFELQQLGRAQDAILEINSSISKWLYASLLTLNTGALLAAGNRYSELSECSARLAITFFVLGCLSAIALGHVTLERAETAARLIGKRTVLLVGIASDSKIDAADEAEAKTLEKNLEDGRWRPRTAGWAAAGFFALGVWMFAFNL